MRAREQEDPEQKGWRRARGGGGGEERSKSVRKRLIPGLLKLRKSWK